MQNPGVRAFVLVYYCWLLALPFAAGQTIKPCEVVPASQKACSYTGLNGDCTITIDRLDPTTPPTIYARPNAKIKIVVINPSPYENLSLDWKSTTAVVPSDTFSTVFSAISPTLGKITVVGAHGLVRGAPEISTEQQQLLDEIQAPLVSAKPALDLIKQALEPPPIGVCSTDPAKVQIWLDPDSWKNKVQPILREAIEKAAHSEAAHSYDALQKSVTALGTEIKTLVTADALELAQLNLNQIALTDALSQRKDLGVRLAELLGAVQRVPSQGVGLNPVPEIREFPSKDRGHFFPLLAPADSSLCAHFSLGASGHQHPRLRHAVADRLANVGPVFERTMHTGSETPSLRRSTTLETRRLRAAVSMSSQMTAWPHAARSVDIAVEGVTTRFGNNLG